jgi:DNA-binding winged helix-turn-helix (wHTH) protein
MDEFQAPDAAAARRWSFGAVVLDERSMRLFVAGRAVGIELKPLELLRHLLCRAGEAVSKDDLVRAVWPGRVISDSALTSTIAKLREALGEDAGAIQTVHGFGYRLDAEVRTAGVEGRDAAGDGAPATPSRRLAAIMFTDFVGYSALAHRDEALAIELLEQHRAWVREVLPRHGGHEVETVGDAFLIEFSGALAAVECALAIQRRFAGHNAAAPASRRMELRIGIHLGDVEHRAGKLMGDGVNIA